MSSHGPERKQSYFACKQKVKCKLEKATNRCSPPSGSAKGGVSKSGKGFAKHVNRKNMSCCKARPVRRNICYMSVFMYIWRFTWRLAGGSTPDCHPLYGTFMSQLSTTEVRHRAYIHFDISPIVGN